MTNTRTSLVTPTEAASTHGRVSIVIVNWNGGTYLERCIRSVLAQTYPTFELLVIDNDSRDSSPAWLAEVFPDLKVLRQKENLGFARAHNLGIRETHSEFYMPLNFDVVLEAGFLENLVAVLRQDRGVGSATGKLLQMDPSGRPTTYIDSVGHIMRKSRRAENRGIGQRDENQFNRLEEVFGVSGTAPLYRRAMLNDVRLGAEYFDGDYFAYWEDVDLDWRAQHAGWKAMYCPDAVGYHYRSGGRSPGDIAVRLTFRNRYLTLLKNDRLVDILKDLPQFLIVELHHWLQMTIDRKYWHLWRMLPSTFRAAPRAWRKRRQIQRRRVDRRNSHSPRRFFLPLARTARPLSF